MGTPRCLLLTLALLLLLASASAAADTPIPDAFSSPSDALCRPLSSAFPFARVAPGPSSELAFCKEYRQRTCCDKSASLTVLRSLSPYFDPSSDVAASFSEACRQIASVVNCAPCHPDVGTGAKAGICPSLCDQWYSACADGLYADVEGVLRPCTDASLVCSPLREVVASGQEFCQRTGFGAGRMSRVTEGERVGDDVQRLLQTADLPDGEEEEPDSLACFDGSVPSATGSRASYTAADAPPAPRSHRHRKSAEEVAELERKRAARAAAAQADDFDNHPVVLALSRAVLTVQNAVRPVMRGWVRLVRKLPFPRPVRRVLEGPLVISAVLLALQTMLWILMRRTYDRCTRRAGAGRRAAPPVFWSDEAHPPSSATPFAAGALSSSGLSADEIRQRRSEKLMQQKYRKRAAGGKHNGTPAASEEDGTSRTAAEGRTYTAIIDGEIVELPE